MNKLIKISLIILAGTILVSCKPLAGASPSSASGSAGPSGSNGGAIKLRHNKKFTKHRLAQRRAIHRIHKNN